MAEITVGELSKVTTELLETPPNGSDSELLKNAFNLYYVQTLTRLQYLLDDSKTSDDDRALELQEFLAYNWNLVKDTSFCYTCLPKHPLTELLCKTAQYVANYHQSYRWYRWPANQLTRLLSNIAKKYVLNYRQAYILPTNPLTKFVDYAGGLLSKIAKYVIDYQQAKDSKYHYAIKILMPTVSTKSRYHITEPAYQDYPDSEKEDILEVLRTHILGQDGTYLVPVKQLPSILNTEPDFNIYFNNDKHDPERKRLSANVGLTRRLIEEFKIDLEIKSPADLDLFMGLIPAEIQYFCEKNKLQQQITSQLENIDDLACFIKINPPEKYSIILALRPLAEKILGNKNHFIALLNFMTPEQCETIIRSIQPILFQWIQDKHLDFIGVIRQLSSEAREPVFKVMKGNWQRIIHNIDDFEKVFKILDLKQQKSFSQELTLLLSDKIVGELSKMTAELLETPPNLSGCAFFKNVFNLYFTHILTGLKALLEDAKMSNDERSYALQGFLANNWELVKNTSLGYTCLPTHPLTELLCKTAQYVANYQQAKDGKDHYAIQMLMPTVITESAHDNYPNLEKEDILEVLRTHILGQDGTYLVPVKQLPSILNIQNTEPAFNLYFKLGKHADSAATVSEDERLRLEHHSPYTEALAALFTQYKEMTKKETHLFARLDILCESLRFNSVKGVGTEENAAGGAYDAIIQFYEYYGLLPDAMKNKIPRSVKKEIDLLFKFVSDESKNRDSSSDAYHPDIATCIATRREKLELLKNQEKTALTQIALCVEDTKSFLAQIKTQFDSRVKELQAALGEKRYSGQDNNVGLTRRLIEEFKINLEIKSQADLALFMGLSPAEIKYFCEENDKLQKQITRQLKTKDELSFFININPPEKYSIILALRPLAEKILGNQNRFVALLNFMTPEQCETIIRSIQPILFQLIQDKLLDFIGVIRQLSSEAREPVFKVMKGNWQRIIHNRDDFEQVFNILDLKQKESFLQELGPFLPLVSYCGPRSKARL